MLNSDYIKFFDYGIAAIVFAADDDDNDASDGNYDNHDCNDDLWII